MRGLAEIRTNGLQAAASLLAVRGLDVGSRELARATSMSVGSLYREYGSKAGVAREVRATAEQELTWSCRQAWRVGCEETSDFRRRFMCFWGALASWAVDHPDLFEFAYLHPDPRALGRETEARALVLQVLEAGLSEGALRMAPAWVLAGVVWGALVELVRASHARSASLTTEEIGMSGAVLWRALRRTAAGESIQRRDGARESTAAPVARAAPPGAPAVPGAPAPGGGTRAATDAASRPAEASSATAAAASGPASWLTLASTSTTALPHGAVASMTAAPRWATTPPVGLPLEAGPSVDLLAAPTGAAMPRVAHPGGTARTTDVARGREETPPEGTAERAQADAHASEAGDDDIAWDWHPTSSLLAVRPLDPAARAAIAAEGLHGPRAAAAAEAQLEEPWYGASNRRAERRLEAIEELMRRFPVYSKDTAAALDALVDSGEVDLDHQLGWVTRQAVLGNLSGP